jgi:hypothetical protein
VTDTNGTGSTIKPVRGMDLVDGAVTLSDITLNNTTVMTWTQPYPSATLVLVNSSVLDNTGTVAAACGGTLIAGDDTGDGGFDLGADPMLRPSALGRLGVRPAGRPAADIDPPGNHDQMVESWTGCHTTQRQRPVSRIVDLTLVSDRIERVPPVPSSTSLTSSPPRLTRRSKPWRPTSCR